MFAEVSLFYVLVSLQQNIITAVYSNLVHNKICVYKTSMVAIVPLKVGSKSVEKQALVQVLRRIHLFQIATNHYQ